MSAAPEAQVASPALAKKLPSLSSVATASAEEVRGPGFVYCRGGGGLSLLASSFPLASPSFPLSYLHLQFLHRVVDTLCERGPSGAAFQKLATAGASDSSVQSAVSAASDLIVAAVGEKWSKDKLTAALTEAGLAGLAPAAGRVLEARTPDVRSALIERTTAMFPLYLKDFDWSVRLVVSSDKVCNMKEVVVLLTLQLRPQDENGHEKEVKTVKIEMTRGELDTFIASLSKAQQVLRDHA